MDLKTTTESLCELVRKQLAKRMEEDRAMEERQEAKGKAVLIFFLVMLGIAALIPIGFLLHHFWLHLKSGWAERVTRTPKTPIKEEGLSAPDYEYNRYTQHADMRVLANDYYSNNNCTEKLRKIIKMVFNLKADASISSYTRIISIKMNGFEFGEKSHEFKPMDGGIPGSYFTYQMFGENKIQVTRYVVGKKSYVAGFCIYIEEGRSVSGVEINMNVIKKLMKTVKYPGKEAVEKKMMEELEKNKKKADKKNILSRFSFKFWKRTQESGEHAEQTEMPPSYSSLSVV